MRLVSALRIKVGVKHKRVGNVLGPRGALESLRPNVTELINSERIEVKANRGAVVRQYAERLISEAVVNGDRHKPTMEMVSWWLDSDRTAIHKLFKVLVPRFGGGSGAGEDKGPYTRLFHCPTNIITNYDNLKREAGDNVVVELRGHPLPKLAYSNSRPNRRAIHNVLLAEAAKEYYSNVSSKNGSEEGRGEG